MVWWVWGEHPIPWRSVVVVGGSSNGRTKEERKMAVAGAEWS